MKKTLKLDLPTTDEITADLEQLTCYPALGKTEGRLAAAEAALSDARQRLEDATKVLDELPAKVSSGAATQADLERAVSTQRAEELMVPEHERALSDAQAALEEARRHARAATVEEARRRRDALQAVADELSPVLEELRDLELALQEALDTKAPQPQDAIELSAARKLAPPIDAVRWVVSLSVTNRVRVSSLSREKIEVRR